MEVMSGFQMLMELHYFHSGSRNGTQELNWQECGLKFLQFLSGGSTVYLYYGNSSQQPPAMEPILLICLMITGFIQVVI